MSYPAVTLWVMDHHDDAYVQILAAQLAKQAQEEPTRAAALALTDLSGVTPRLRRHTRWMRRLRAAWVHRRDRRR